MADSNITKKALALSLKSLMEEREFSKISVMDICEKCNMNRKSFYYHFKDKYDLVNWIFDMELHGIIEEEMPENIWELLEILCHYFYRNKKFYRQALQIKGQNSFEEHFIEFLIPVMEIRMKEVLCDEDIKEFYINFCMDAFLGSVKRWILNKKNVPPEEFMELLKSCVYMIEKIPEGKIGGYLWNDMD